MVGFDPAKPDVREVGKGFGERVAPEVDRCWMSYDGDTPTRSAEFYRLDSRESVAREVCSTTVVEEVLESFISAADITLCNQGVRNVRPADRRTMCVHENILEVLSGFRYDAHPMAVLSAVVGSMSAYYHDTMDINDPHAQDIILDSLEVS